MSGCPVVIAYDGSPHAQAAIERAAELLRPRHAVVVCAWRPLEVAAPAASIATPKGVALAGARGLDAKERHRAERLAAEGATRADAAGLTAEPRAIGLDGPAWHAIVDCASSLDAVAVVTGSRGRPRALTALLGSTAVGVLQHAGRPVLVVTAP
jgi:nucleotide-binding universal stress UspA family protein